MQEDNFSNPASLHIYLLNKQLVSTQFRASPFERALLSALNRVLLIN